MGSSYKWHRVSFFFLIFVTILDPGNNILKLKEFFFVITFAFGLLQFRKYSNNTILIGSVFLSIVFPVIWTIFGYLFDYNFLPEFAIMYLKAFAFFLLINVSLDTKINFAAIFSISTLLIVPVTIILFFFIGSFELADIAFKEFDNTFVVSRRAFGGFVFDPVVFYKTSPLLLFGVSYLCSKKGFKFFLTINFILILLCLITMIISGTRANMLCCFIILVFYMYQNYFSSSKIKKYFFWGTFFISFFIFIIPFLGTYVFDKSEQSNETKLSLIGDYFLFWKDNLLSIFFGQGLGGGFMTTERGLSYMAEPTYFEIVRMFGLFGGAIMIIFITLPIYLFFISKSSPLYNRYLYVLIAYILYAVLEISSNPLLLASTGMIVMVVVYSASINVYLTRKQVNLQ